MQDQVHTQLTSKIRDIPDFPKPGILFKDITPLLACSDTLSKAIKAMTEPYLSEGITAVVGLESRGFIFAPSIAMQLGACFVPARKPGKLPYKTKSQTYELEYGTDTLEMHEDAIGPKDKVLIVDDLLATGGTARAGADLIKLFGAEVVGCTFLIELAFLKGREKLVNTDIHSLIVYNG